MGHRSEGVQENGHVHQRLYERNEPVSVCCTDECVHDCMGTYAENGKRVMANTGEWVHASEAI